MGTMCVKVAHRFFPGSRRVVIGHGEHQIHERCNRLGFPGLFLRRDRANATGHIVARYAMPRRRARQLWGYRFCRTARAGLLIELFHLLRPQCRDQTHSVILRRSASARKPGSCNSNGPRPTSRHTAVTRSHAAMVQLAPDRHGRDPDLCNRKAPSATWTARDVARCAARNDDGSRKRARFDAR
jgi:hypothetical protein